jgi:hypothetical protein
MRIGFFGRKKKVIYQLILNQPPPWSRIADQKMVGELSRHLPKDTEADNAIVYIRGISTNCMVLKTGYVPPLSFQDCGLCVQQGVV